MTESSRKRGRPATINTDVAMQAIVEIFRAKGFAAVSLDDLSEATGLSRPSLYRSFGDKLSMYMRALDAFGHEVITTAVPSLAKATDLSEGLTEFFTKMLDIYFRDDAIEPGCLIYGTAPSSADLPEVKERLRISVDALDDLMRAKFKLSVPECSDKTLEMAVQIASNTLIAFSVRAKSGAPKSQLSEMGAQTAETVTGLLKGPIEED